MRNQETLNNWNKSRLQSRPADGTGFGRDRSIERGQIE